MLAFTPRTVFGLQSTHFFRALLRSRRKRRRVLPLLALASLLQVGALQAVALTAVVFFVVSNQNDSCATTPFIIPADAPGHATYLDLSVPFETLASACASPQPISAPPTVETQPANSALVNELLAPLVNEAQQRREARVESEPQVAKRVDPALNDGRINFLFFGYGDTYEPPEPVHFKGSINLFSLDLRTLNISSITLNHDIRAPEVEHFQQTNIPTKIHMAYPVGGFDLMRDTVEDATGLSVDFQLTMEDGVIARAVDDVFGALDVDSPFDLDARPIYLDGVEYPEFHFAAGTQKLDGLHALQYIKAVMKGEYDASKELTVRKQIVVKALVQATQREVLNPLFWTRVLRFMHNEVARHSIGYDFDVPALVFAAAQKFAALGTFLPISEQARGNMILPRMGQSLYVVDYLSGDGGVEWVTGSLNPLMQHDVASGVYAADQSFSVPKGDADPYADDLVANYWTSVRELVKQRLLTNDE